MAQVTEDMCEWIIKYAEEGKMFPLTINELQQLAYIARAALADSNDRKFD